jgi:hypothetical protein
MKPAITATLSAVVLGVAACTTVTTSSGPTSPAPSASSAKPPASTSAPSASTTPAPQQAAPGMPAATSPNVTDPWAVVSAYYGDIESGNFSQAWALINSGATTGQTYQQFVSGFACTGLQNLTELGESGDQVTFDLDATNSCTGQVQHFTGTDTVQNGRIVAANVVQTG